MEKKNAQDMLEKLSYKKKNVFEQASADEIKEIFEYSKGYMKFLDDAKTEREAVIAAIALIEKQGFDFIIGSLHNLVGVPDFCMLDYTKMTDRQIELLWQRDLDETYRLLLDEGTHGCKIDTLAHLTYPVRYILRAGKTLDMKPFIEQIEQIFLRLIEKGIALEINTSGLRQGAGMTFPDESLMRFYRSLGGEMVTVGSDAHFSEHVGCNIRETYELLREIGFSYVCYFGHNGLTQISLN
jgi:histidinol-phosphatase (PHP family)